MSAAIALAFAAIATGPVERPIGVMVVPSPRVVLPRLRGLVKLDAGAGKRLKQDSNMLGFDPLDPAALEARGVDLGAPIHVWIVAERAPLVVELALAKPELAGAAIARAEKRNRGRDPPTVIVRRGSRLFVQLEHARSGASTEADGFPAIRSAEVGVKPKAAPRIARESADLWVVVRGTQGVERIDAGVWLGEGRMEVRAEAWLDFAVGLIAGDLAGTGAARRLLDAAAPGVRAVEPAAELAARAGPNAIAEALGLARLGPELARVLTGEVHVVLTRGGSIAGALALAKQTTPAQAEKVQAALAAHASGAELSAIEHNGERMLLAFVPGADGAETHPSLQTAPKQPLRCNATAAAPQKPIEACLRPPALFGALERRARAKDALSLSRTRVAGAELYLGYTAARLKRVELELALPAGTVQATLRMEW